MEAAPSSGAACARSGSAATASTSAPRPLFTAAPEPLKLVADLDLTDDLVRSRSAITWIAGSGGLRPLPAGVGPAGPPRLGPLLTSRLLGPPGLARAAQEPLVPSTASGEDASVGDVLGRRFGRQVVDRIVDPLLGGLHAGDVHRLSLDAATPQLAALLGRHRSILLATRRRRAANPHGFVAVRGGLGRLFEVTTFVTTKWPHLPSPHVLVRASAGRSDDVRATRLGDDELVDALTRDLTEVAGLDAAPPRPPGRAVGPRDAPARGRAPRAHPSRARTAVVPPGVALAGASYDGVGVASAMRSGNAAAQQVLAHLTGATA